MPCGCSCDGRRWVAGPAAEVGISGLAVVLSPTAHWLRRLAWAAALTTALFWLIVQLRLGVLRLQNQSIATFSSTTNWLQLPFPAVTVCPGGERFDIDKVLNMTNAGTTAETWRSSKEDRYKLIRWREFNFDQFFSRASHTWSDLVENCWFQGSRCDAVGSVTRSVTSQLGTCFTLRQNASAAGTWTKPQLTLDLRLPARPSAGSEEDSWQVVIHPASLQFDDARMLVKSSLSHVKVSPATATYVRMHRRWHRHVSTDEDPCSDGISAEENARCVMNCILQDEQFALQEEEGGFQNNATGAAGSEEGNNAESVPTCILPWEESDSDTRNPCSTYPAFKKALRSSPDLGAFNESQVLEAYLMCSCPFQCTELSYPIEIPEKVSQGLPGAADGPRSARLELWLSMQEETLQDQWSFTFSQLVAEAGGNTGIFLGASLLSLLETLDWLVFWVVRRLGARAAVSAGGRKEGAAPPAVTSVTIKVSR